MTTFDAVLVTSASGNSTTVLGAPEAVASITGAEHIGFAEAMRRRIIYVPVVFIGGATEIAVAADNCTWRLPPDMWRRR
jgi:hypothetical protein